MSIVTGIVSYRWLRFRFHFLPLYRLFHFRYAMLLFHFFAADAITDAIDFRRFSFSPLLLLMLMLFTLFHDAITPCWYYARCFRAAAITMLLMLSPFFSPFSFASPLFAFDIDYVAYAAFSPVTARPLLLRRHCFFMMPVWLHYTPAVGCCWCWYYATLMPLTPLIFIAATYAFMPFSRFRWFFAIFSPFASHAFIDISFRHYFRQS